jgi:hypothetical protein
MTTACPALTLRQPKSAAHTPRPSVTRAAISTVLAVAWALFGISWDELRDRRIPPHPNAAPAAKHS